MVNFAGFSILSGGDEPDDAIDHNTSDQQHFSFEDFGDGASIVSPGGTGVHVRGDSYWNLVHQIEAVDRHWQHGNPNSSIFGSQEDHLDAIFCNYFGVGLEDQEE